MRGRLARAVGAVHGVDDHATALSRGSEELEALHRHFGPTLGSERPKPRVEPAIDAQPLGAAEEGHVEADGLLQRVENAGLKTGQLGFGTGQLCDERWTHSAMTELCLGPSRCAAQVRRE
jgi:hypothetical protein